MGGHVQQTNPGQASGAYNNATGAGKQLQAAEAADLTRQNAYMNYMFGSNGKGGTMSQFTNPSSLNVKGPTGPYDIMYKNQVGTIANTARDARTNMRAEMNNRGFNSGSGMENAMGTQLALGEAGAKGQAYSDAFNNSYQTALNNFWNANNLMAGQAATLGGQGIQAGSSAAQTYNNLYGTAGQGTYVPGMGASIIGALGTLGGAAINKMTFTPCPAEGALIISQGATWMGVEKLRAGVMLLQFDSLDTIASPLLETPKVVEADCVTVVAENGTAGVVSEEHPFMLSRGGYVRAKDAAGWLVMTKKGPSKIKTVTPAGRKKVYPIVIEGNRTYCADGFWAFA